MRRFGLVCAMWAVVCGCLMASQSAVALSVDELLTRAGQYLVGYEKAFATVVSEEHYVQTVKDKRAITFSAPSAGARRELRSDVIAAADTGHAWMSFRDVFAMDGRQVRDRDERLQKLFLDPKNDPLDTARAIADESARFNLGTVSRNVNFPTMALTFLAAVNQSRSHFTRRRQTKIDGVETVELAFEEIERPTIVKSGVVDLPVSGRFWIEPATGRVMRSMLQFEARDFSGEVTVTFGYIEKLKMWMPVEMNDTCGDPRETVTGRASYSNFRRFGVSTEVVIK